MYVQPQNIVNGEEKKKINTKRNENHRSPYSVNCGSATAASVV